jgi:hypothetical protein
MAGLAFTGSAIMGHVKRMIEDCAFPSSRCDRRVAETALVTIMTGGLLFEMAADTIHGSGSLVIEGGWQPGSANLVALTALPGEMVGRPLRFMACLAIQGFGIFMPKHCTFPTCSGLMAGTALPGIMTGWTQRFMARLAIGRISHHMVKAYRIPGIGIMAS